MLRVTLDRHEIGTDPSGLMIYTWRFSWKPHIIKPSVSLEKQPSPVSGPSSPYYHRLPEGFLSSASWLALEKLLWERGAEAGGSARKAAVIRLSSVWRGVHE